MELEQLNGTNPLGASFGARARMIAVGVVVSALAIAGATGLRAQDSGILLLAHGGDKNWNTLVNELAARVNERLPIEVAFGMADRSTMQEAVSRLTQRGVGRLEIDLTVEDQAL